MAQPTAPRRPCRLPLAFELLHDLQEAIVGGRVAAKADLHLVEVCESVLHLRGTRRPWVAGSRYVEKKEGWKARDRGGVAPGGTGLQGELPCSGEDRRSTRRTESQRVVPRGLEEFRVRPRAGGEDRRVSERSRSPLGNRGTARVTTGPRGGPRGSEAHRGVPGMTGTAEMTKKCREGPRHLREVRRTARRNEALGGNRGTVGKNEGFREGLWGPRGPAAQSGGRGGAARRGAGPRGFGSPRGDWGRHSRAPAASRGRRNPNDPSGNRRIPGPRSLRRLRAPCWKSEPRLPRLRLSPGRACAGPAS